MLQAPGQAQTWLLNGCERMLDPTVLQDPWNVLWGADTWTQSGPHNSQPQRSQPCAHTSATVSPEGMGTQG